MDSLDHPINRRIMMGKLPVSKLYPVYKRNKAKEDIRGKAQKGIAILRKEPQMCLYLFNAFKSRVHEMESVNMSAICDQEICALINTGYSPESIMPLTYIEASELYPAVTDIDKILLYAASLYNYVISNGEGYIKSYKDMLYAWLYLFESVQQKEKQCNKTIKIDEMLACNSLIDLLLGDWKQNIDSCLRELEECEKKQIKELDEKRDRLCEKICAEEKEGERIEELTSNNWTIFIQIINDISTKESETVEKIMQASSAKEKIRCIMDYTSIITKIENKKYILDNEEIELIKVLNGVKERFTKSECLCSLEEDGKEPFRITPTLLSLLINPKTYNYLYMMFHQFRIKPNKENASSFFQLALSCLYKNLGYSYDEVTISIEESIVQFYQAVSLYLKENKNNIDKLLYREIQPDGVFDTQIISGIISSDMLRENINDFLQDNTEELMNKGTCTQEEIILSIRKVEKMIEASEYGERAHRLVVSINIIYMVVEAIRIVLNNKHANIKVKEKGEIEKIRKELRKIDDKLIHVVYANLNDQQMGMPEYREKVGLDIISLVEIEYEEEKYRNSLFAETAKRNILELINQIQKQNIEELMIIRSEIRNEIFVCPDCDDKELYVEWLEEVSDYLCNTMIEKCKNLACEYTEGEERLFNHIGEYANVLPRESVDALVTAELLFKKYAITDYANKGFDYSSISALYYQAFEAAYNTLIWKGYSQKLNSLIINNVEFTTYLEGKRNSVIKDADYQGYLSNDSHARKNYINYRSKKNNITKTVIKDNCMYGNFMHIMKEVNQNGNLKRFCDYFANITGFINRSDMFLNNSFMSKCAKFTSDIECSKDNRNNASHGGTRISIGQCKNDKEAILTTIGEIRAYQLGLIQQLIELLTFNKNNQC